MKRMDLGASICASSRRLGVVLLFVFIALSSCDDSDPLPPPPPPPPGEVPETGFESLVAETEEALESYWEEHLSTVTTEPWMAPASVEIYTDAQHPSTSECLDSDSRVWIGNSIYCPPDQSLYLNSDWLQALGEEFPTNPDSAAVVIHAHEFGHHLQSIAGDRFNLEIGQELQADCYAGVFLSAVQAGNTSLDIGDPDVSGALETIRGIADTPFGRDEWFSRDAHGGPIERAAAMATGYLTEDASFCSGYEVTGPIQQISIGDYALRLPPAATYETLETYTHVKIGSHPELNIDLQHWTGLQADPVDALVALAPDYFGSSTVEYVGNVEPFGAVVGYGVASVRYQQILDSITYHGALLLVTRRDGTGMVLDSYRTGPAPPADDHEAWQLVGDYVFSALWGVTG